VKESRSTAWRAGRLAAVALATALTGAPAFATALSEQLAAFLSERAAEPVARIDVPPHESLAAEAAAAGVRTELSMASGRAEPGANAVTVKLFRGDGAIRRAVVTVRVWVLRDVVVAARALRSGDVLAAEDVLRERREVAGPRGDELADAGSAVGRRVARHVGAGEPLRSAWLKEALRVKRGDRVTLRLARGALTIETPGRAEEDGSAGAWIRVRNATSNRDLVGRVAADGVVHVAL
jgi:flagella basal body P-ring formation protein FlgA